MSEHAFCSRRADDDSWISSARCARSGQHCADARNYGDSPVSRSSVPITSAMFRAACASDARSLETACITKTRHSHEAPLRVDRGVLATPAKRVPAT